MSHYTHPFEHSSSRVPTLAELEVTSACNAECVFCPRELFRRPTYITRPVFQQVVSRLHEGGVRHVKLVGIGEPTMHKDLFWMLEELRAHDMEPLLNTNGSLLHRLDLRRLLDLCGEVIFSLHSLDPAIHARIFGAQFHEKAIANLDALLAANVSAGRRITLYVVLTRINPGADVEIRARYGDRARVRVSGCTNRAVPGFAGELIDLSINERTNHYPTIDKDSPMCGYAEAAVVIDSLGRYLLCTNDVVRDTGIGHVADVSVAEAFGRIQAGLRAGRFLELCQKCENFEPYRANLRARAAG